MSRSTRAVNVSNHPSTATNSRHFRALNFGALRAMRIPAGNHRLQFAKSNCGNRILVDGMDRRGGPENARLSPPDPQICWFAGIFGLANRAAP